MSVVIPVILCGGSGTRLWPLSRSDRPKQMISLVGVHTLLEGTLLRAKAIADAGDPICVTAAAYGAEVRQSLDRLGLRGRLLLEPEPRNTAPALCAAALVAMRIDADAVIVALPADHVIEDGDSFTAAIARAVAAAEKSWLTVLGVRPRHASSALGYIVPAASIDGVPQVTRVSRFVEKPEPEIAESLVAAGALWNAGIVVARADAVIAAMRKHEPAVLKAVERSLAAGGNGTGDIQLGAKDFAAAPRISFDKAVLERDQAVAVAALDVMWRDVGTWAEVAELYPADGNGNRKTGRVHLSSSRDTFVLSPNRMTVGIGLKDLVVVDTPDALLIANRNDLGLLREAVEGMTAGSYPEVAAGDGMNNVNKSNTQTGVVVIGRNEGQRLVACLRSLAIDHYPVVYVDSGSSDDSVRQAKNLGAEVVALDMSSPFTAARARNAGLSRLNEKWPSLQYVHFVDGDCVMVVGWLAAGESFLDGRDDVAVVCGRVREIQPEATIYNRLCDIEWDMPVGEATQCGGIAMMRIPAILDVGGFRNDLKAGEEPELCLRLREKGWKIWRLQNEMARHDADIRHFDQWWQRSLRGGFAYAAVSQLHARSTKRIWLRETVRALFWGLALPVAILAIGVLQPAALLLFLVYPLQIARIAIRRGVADPLSWRYGIFMTIAKFAEAAGIVKYLISRF
jgi:mannose-1-phosphate guanylyltransferase/mannose-6-phosphate isomerase